MGIGSAIGAIVGANKQEDAAKSAAKASTQAAAESAAVQKYMFDEMMKLNEPYNKLGVAGVDAFSKTDPTGGAAKYQAQIENMPALSLPSLDLNSFNFAFNPNDPTYQYRQGEMEKTINQAAAARGNYNSRPVINALSEGNIALTADESEKQFGRALDTYNANISTALSQYGADYGKTTDTYNAGYGKLTDLYNIANQLGSAEYNQMLDAVKIGQGSASSAGAGALATGQGLANTYGQLGSNLSQAALLKGQTQSDLYSGLGNSLSNMYLYALMGSGGR
jgi:hypothetical protein